jgi:hypothetical protein
MRHWRELQDEADFGLDIVVIGNGPSRIGDPMSDVPGALRIACNAYWQEGFSFALACYDAEQATLALRHADPATVLIVPEQREPQVTLCGVKSEDEDRIFEAAPHRGGGDWSAAYNEPDWSPLKLSLGNLAGLLAYQAALVMRPRAIFLHGMDCSGIVINDRVRLSAIDDATPGYGPSSVPFSALQAAAPRSWEQYRTLWHALTRWGADRGIPTYRTRDAGALDWLEIKHPCPDRRIEERLVSKNSR